MAQFIELLQRQLSAHRPQTVRLIFSLSVLAGLLISGLAYRTIMQFKTDARWVAHTQEVISKLDQLEALLSDAEIGQRGYTIAGSAQELSAYQDSITKVPPQITTLRSLMEDNSEQQQRLTMLDSSIQDLIELYDFTTNGRNQPTVDHESPIVLIDQTRPLRTEIHTLITAMIAVENQLLAEREARYNNTDQQVFTGLVGGTLLVGLLLFAIFFMLDREIANRKLTELQLRSSEAELKAVFAAMSDVILELDREGKYQKIYATKQAQSNVDTQAVLGKKISDVLPASTAQLILGYIRQALATRQTVLAEYPIVYGTVNSWVSAAISPLEGQDMVIVVARDITRRREAEEALKWYTARMETLAEISHLSAEIISDYSSLLDTLARRISVVIGDGCVLTLLSDDGEWLTPVMLYHTHPEAAEFFRKITMPSRIGQGLVGRVYTTGQSLLIPVIDQEQIRTSLNPQYWPYLERFGMHSLLIVPLRVQGKVIGTLGLTRDKAGEPYTPDDQTYLENLANRAALAISNARLVQAQQEELAERKRIETILIQHEAQLAKAQEIAHIGSWEFNLATNALIWSDELYRIYGYKPQEFEPTTDHFYSRIHPADQERVRAILKDVFQNPKPHSFEHRVVLPDQTERTLIATSEVVLDGSGKLLRIVGIVQDITEQKAADEALAMAMEDLRRSNEELEQFAYVASHDLQEPLRMVASYVELLKRRYQGQLDEKADKYIGYAVDGAVRMQQLINDLLAYSRVGRQDQEFVPVDTEQLLKHTLKNLKNAIKDQHATVTHDPLPTISGNPTQLAQVFQNLIGNAIKFHGTESPSVHITAQQVSGDWQFSIRDNGIGIAPEYADRIFVLFKRLHTHAEYPGTGIGAGNL